MNRSINNEPDLETQCPWGTEQSVNDIPTWVQLMSTYKLEMSLKKTNYSTVLTLGLSDGLCKPQHRHMLSLAPNPALTSPPACDITTRVTSPVSGLTHHCLPILTHKVPFDPLTAPLIALRPPARLPVATRKCQGHGRGEQGAIKRQWPTSCFACGCKQVIHWLPGREREQKSIQKSSELCDSSQGKRTAWFGGCASKETCDKQNRMAVT